MVKVEGNYFLRTKDPIGWFEGPEPGSWEVRDNVFDACSGSQPETSNGALDVPYDYTLDAAADVPALVEANAGVVIFMPDLRPTVRTSPTRMKGRGRSGH